MSSPTFTVLVPTYNHASYVGQALDSLIAQTDPDWEAIVVNDGSTDDTREVLEGYATKDSRIRVYHKENGGAASALNHGLKQARGEWICWLSSDDLFDPRKLEIHREWSRRCPDTRFFFTHFRELDGQTGKITDVDPWRRVPEDRWQILEILESNYLSGITVCIHRAALEAAGPFDETMRYSQDYDMWLRLLPENPAKYINERTCLYRRHSGQYSDAHSAACFFDSARIAIKFLNRHRLEDMFPLVDFTDGTSLRRMLDRVIDAAANPHAFLYKMGAHFGLIGRIIEWLYSDRPGDHVDELRTFFRRRAVQNARAFGQTDLGLLWQLTATVSAAEWQAPPFQQIDLAAVSTGYCMGLDPGDGVAVDLRDYLLRFEQTEVPECRFEGPVDTGDVLFVAPVDCDITVDVPYGAHRATLEMAEHLRQRRMRVALAGVSRYPVGFVGHIPFFGVTTDVGVSRALRRLGVVDTVVGVGRTDVLLHCHARRFVVYHHNMHYIHGGIPPSVLNRLGVMTVCVSQYSMTALAEAGLLPEHLRVVRNGYDRQRFRWGRGTDRKRHSLIFAGNVCQYKGPDIALRAFSAIKDAFPNATLDVYGNMPAPWQEDSECVLGGVWFDECRLLDWDRIVEQFPGVTYHGEVPPEELAQAFSRHSLLVMPSRSENFPLVSLEAQACGCTPVLPRVGGMPETVEHGCGGYVYDENSPAALSRTVIALWESGRPTEDERVAAAARVESSCVWRQSAQQFQGVLRDAPALRPHHRIMLTATRLHRRLVNKLQRVARGKT